MRIMVAEQKSSGKFGSFVRGLNKQRIGWDFIFGEDNSLEEITGAIEQIIHRNIVTLPLWQGEAQPREKGLWKVLNSRIGAGKNVNPKFFLHQWYFTEQKYAAGYAEWYQQKTPGVYCSVSCGF